MKNSVLSVLVLLLSIGSFAQDGAFERAMGQALSQFGQARTVEDMHATANTFERIVSQAPDELYPHYYAALVLINSTFLMEDPAAKDEVLDRVMDHIEKAEAIAPGDDEVEVLNGFALMARMVVDPATRGQNYSPRVMKSFVKALSINPENPRAAALMARQEFGTAQFFGSDPSRACSMAAKSLALFEKEKAHGFAPSWGRETAEAVMTACAQKK